MTKKKEQKKKKRKEKKKKKNKEKNKKILISISLSTQIYFPIYGFFWSFKLFLFRKFNQVYLDKQSTVVVLRKPWRKVGRQLEFSPSSSMHTPEKGNGKLWWIGYKDHTICAGVILVVILVLRPGNKENISVNTALWDNQTVGPTVYRRARDLPL